MRKTALGLIVALMLSILLTGCGWSSSSPSPGMFVLQPSRSKLVANIVVVDSDTGQVYSTQSSPPPKALGDILQSVSFTIDGDNVPAPVTKTVTASQWRNPDGSMNPIAVSFSDILPGQVTLAVSGTAAQGAKVLGGAVTVVIEPNTTATATVVATWAKGTTELGLDPNTPVPQIK